MAGGPEQDLRKRRSKKDKVDPREGCEGRAIWEIYIETQKCILLNYELSLDETPFCKHCIQRLLEQIAVVEQSVSDAILLD